MLTHFRSVMVPALKHIYDSIGVGTTINTTLLPFEDSNDFPDLSTIYNFEMNPTLRLPLHPDVVVHFRCSDNIAFANMGLTQFHTILNLIPSDSEFIMILTEGNTLSNAILKVLRLRILAKYPSVTQVIIREGGSIFSPIVSLVHAKTVICSASSFCFFFATSNVHGKVYMPTRPFYGNTVKMENFNTLEDQPPVRRWFHPDGSDIDVDWYHWPQNMRNDAKFIEEKATAMIAILENQTYTKAIKQ